MPWLKKHGKALGERAQRGDVRAQKVIDAYARVHKRFDPVAHHLLKVSIDEWKAVEELF
jgi:hypothetical protein